MPPNCTNEANFLTVERYFDSLMIDPETKHVLCGDFNVNFFNKQQKSRKFKNRSKNLVGILMLIFLINSKKAESLKTESLAGNGLRISNNNEPKRVSNGRGTLIDAIFSYFLIETKVTSTCITDHHTVEGSLDLDGSPEKSLKSRNWHNLDNPITREKLEKDLR